MRALTRPHGRNQDQKSKNGKTYPNGRPRREELVSILPQRRGLGLKPVPDFLRRHIHHGRPSTRVHPELALATSTSWADELEPAAFCGSGAEVAFPARWRPDH